MEHQNNNTVEFITTCSEVYWTLQEFSNELNTIKGIKQVDFNQSMYGSKKNDLSEPPVGFGWDIDILYIQRQDETYTFEVTYESEWVIYAERSIQTDDGFETQEVILDMATGDTSVCIELVCQGFIKFMDVCKKSIQCSVE